MATLVIKWVNYTFCSFAYFKILTHLNKIRYLLNFLLPYLDFNSKRLVEVTLSVCFRAFHQWNIFFDITVHTATSTAEDSLAQTLLSLPGRWTNNPVVSEPHYCSQCALELLDIIDIQ